MSKRGNGYGSDNRVNILKKIKIGKNWNLYPAVVELNGKLRDKVRVHGKVESIPRDITTSSGGRMVENASRSKIAPKS
jgi:hypothetical protein